MITVALLMMDLIVYERYLKDFSLEYLYVYHSISCPGDLIYPGS